MSYQGTGERGEGHRLIIRLRMRDVRAAPMIVYCQL
jgi:hypothetical protein